MMRHLFVILITLFGLTVQAQQAVPFTQRLQQTTGQGSVVLIQDEAIADLVNNMPKEEKPVTPAERPARPPKGHASTVTAGSDKPSGTYTGQRQRHKVRGYRVQVFTGSGAAAKQKAKAVESRIRSSFPELSVYCRFKSPRWICRVGDFSNREDAQRYLTKIRNMNLSDEATIVSDEVFVVK